MPNFTQLTKWIFVLCLLIVGVSEAKAESISNFTVEYSIQQNSLIEVHETIVYDFESDHRHGIYRTLSRKHAQGPTAWYKNRLVDIDVLYVTRDGKAEPFVLYDYRDELEIKIGDPNKTITGTHEYEIVYRLSGALSYGSEGVEFYWNVTGNDWAIPIRKVDTFVQSEVKDIFVSRNACYQGGFGSTDGCDEIRIVNEGVRFTTDNLSISEGLTVAVGLDPDKVAFSTTEKISYVLLLGIFVLFWLIFFSYRVYSFRTENKINKPVVAQYEPYEDYLPMYTGVLFDGRLDSKDITAGIIYLAEQGFIKIKKTEKKVFLFIKVDDYEITLLRPVSDIPTEFLKEVFGLLFDSFSRPPKTVFLSELAKKRVENTKIIRKLNSSLREDLKKSEFIVNSWPLFGWLLLVMPVALLFVAIVFSLEAVFVLLVFMIVPTIILLVLLLMARKTRKGYEAVNHLKGFKLFLSVTDEERFKFHNSPQKSPELFMKFLPYAVALGVEKEWAKVFEDITVPQPDWYEGGHYGAFSATDFTRDISAFSTSFTANSGTSGSSGGGSSGGGGGGGGGGSW